MLKSIKRIVFIILFAQQTIALEQISQIDVQLFSQQIRAYIEDESLSTKPEILDAAKKVVLSGLNEEMKFLAAEQGQASVVYQFVANSTSQAIRSIPAEKLASEGYVLRLKALDVAFKKYFDNKWSSLTPSIAGLLIGVGLGFVAERLIRHASPNALPVIPMHTFRNGSYDIRTGARLSEKAVWADEAVSAMFYLVPGVVGIQVGAHYGNDFDISNSDLE